MGNGGTRAGGDAARICWAKRRKDRSLLFVKIDTVARFLYAVEGWALAALGVIHMAATSRYSQALTPQALWFLSGGALMVFAAALNLLNRAYGANARGLRWVCVAGNLFVTAFAVATGLVGHASVGQWVTLFAILGPLTSLSFFRGALREGSSPRAA